LLAPYTTLRIGGPARYFVEIHTEDELMIALAFAQQHQLSVFMLGGGSNVLISDEGFPGLVLRLSMKGIERRDEGEQTLVTARAGEDWDNFVGQCVEDDLAGIECLSGIPGSVGGTPVQNVGAYGQEVSETIVSVRAYNRQTQSISELNNDECRFGYRSSLFNTISIDHYIVLAVTYALRPNGRPAIRYPDLKSFFPDGSLAPSLKEVRETVRMIRARKSMLIVSGDPDCCSVGSFFKNPMMTPAEFERVEEAAKSGGLIFPDERVPNFAVADNKVKVPAAWLIEQAGFQKGYRKGRVGISSKHSLAIINRGGATAHEVLELAREIEQGVQEKFGIHLRQEPVLVGFQDRQR